MSWFIEGKISEWSLNVVNNEVIFEIKATNDYQVKEKDITYNVVLNASVPPQASVEKQDAKFKVDKSYLPFFVSCKDNIMRFEFKDASGNRGTLESITVK